MGIGFRRTAELIFVLFGSATASAQTCDCSRFIGSCQGAISVSPRGTTGSYGADLGIRSSAPRCSRVDYYVDNTPYFNVLSNTSTTEDSVFGTSPITQGSVSDVQCRVCAMGGTAGSTEPALSKSYFIQFGGRLPNANHALLAEMVGKKFGVPGHLVSSLGGYYRVRLGPVSGKSEAE